MHNYAYATLDTELFESLVQPGCTFCTSTLNDLQEARSNSSSISGSDVHVQLVIVPPGKIGARVLVATIIAQDAGVESHVDGTKENFPAIEETQSSIALQWTSANEWLVHDVAIDDAKST